MDKKLKKELIKRITRIISGGDELFLAEDVFTALRRAGLEQFRIDSAVNVAFINRGLWLLGNKHAPRRLAARIIHAACAE